MAKREFGLHFLDRCGWIERSAELGAKLRGVVDAGHEVPDLVQRVERRRFAVAQAADEGRVVDRVAAEARLGDVVPNAKGIDFAEKLGLSWDVHGARCLIVASNKVKRLFDVMQIAVDKIMLDNTNIMPRDGGNLANSPIYDALLAVKPEGLSLNAWTVKAGVGRSIFTEIRRHGNPTRETLDKLLDAIGVTQAQFESAGGGTVRTEVRRSPVADFRPAEGQSNIRDLPLLGTALGGELPDLEGLDEDSADLIELDLGEVIDHLERPAAIAADRDAYALTILGDSMAPRFEPGERILVSPRAPVGIGDDVVVQLRGREGDDERVKLVLVKRLVRRSPGFVELRQFNPESVFRVPVERLARDSTNRHRIHKVVGSVFRP